MIILGDPMFCYTAIIGQKPLLPAGYRLIERYGEWVQVESPDGRRYFIAKWQASQRWVLWRCVARGYKCPCCSSVKLRYVMDDSQEIQLPQLQLQYAN